MSRLTPWVQDGASAGRKEEESGSCKEEQGIHLSHSQVREGGKGGPVPRSLWFQFPGAGEVLQGLGAFPGISGSVALNASSNTD